jgi:hypothetical protein
MRITESRLRQIIQETMSEVEKQAHTEERNYKNELESAVYGLQGTYLELYGDDDKAANAVLTDVMNILGF